MTAVDIGRHSILLVRTSDEVNAYQNICPHERYRLNDGTFNDGVVTCPGHNWCFDARTGQGIRPRGARLQRYNARVADGRIEIALP
jgi:toluene monooxygenase system ferredoxin subunit